MKLRPLLFTLAAIQFCHILDFMLMMPLGPNLMRTFAITPKEFGLLVSAYTFTAGLMGLLGALFLDHIDRKVGICVFFAGFTIGTFLCGCVNSYALLLTVRSITGLFGGLLSSQVFAIVGDSVPFEERGRGMGVVTLGFSLASILGVPFAILLSANSSWKSPFFALAGLSVIVFFLIVKYVPSLKKHVPEQRPQNAGQVFAPYRDAIRRPEQRIALTFISLVVLGQFTIITFLSPSMVANVGFTEKQLGLIYLLGGLVSVVFAPQIGKWADRFGKPRIFQIAAVTSIIPIFAITHLGHVAVPWALAITSFFFICMNGRMIPTMAMMSSVVPPAKRGGYMSLTNSVQSFSCAIAAYVAGLIVEKSSTGELLHYERAGYLAILFTFFAVYLSRRIKVSQSA